MHSHFRLCWGLRVWCCLESCKAIRFKISNVLSPFLKWFFSKTNPGLFSSVDGEGFLDIWDLAEDIENPAYHEQEGKTKYELYDLFGILNFFCKQSDKFALNKCRWSIDGTKLATGDSRGNMNIYNLDRKVSIIISSFAERKKRKNFFCWMNIEFFN